MASRSFPDGGLKSADTRDANGAATQAPLAHRTDFAIGNATIRPSRRTVVGPVASLAVEPRVMRVLLALADAGGAVLSRDDLIVICWDGVIVGDDSINRAVSELRRVARETGAEFGIETIPRVGYRLQCDLILPVLDAGVSTALRVPRLSRRQAIAGAFALVGAGVVGWTWWRPRPDPRAAQLLLRGEQAVRDELPDSAEQGVGFLKEAVAIEPDNARAWGLLALALRNVVENAPPDEVAPGVAETEAAAGRALALDDRDPNALAAVAALRPVYGDWLAAEQRLRGVLAVAPNHAWTLSALGVLMESVGRSRESAELVARAAEVEPLSPVHQYRLAYKHWILGRTPAADQVIDRALQLWPRHPAVLLARLLIFTYTGRYRPALTMLNDAEDRKAMMPSRAAELWRTTLEALDTRHPPLVRTACDAQVAAAVRSPGFAVLGIQMLTMLGDVDAAFRVADGYLLRQGRLIGALRTSPAQMAVNDQRWRKTMMLFNPATAPMRADPRFAGMVESMGLVAYWRASGARPDYQLER